MHELPVTENLLEIALKHAESSQAVRILRLNIVLGQLASIVDDSIQFYWDIISKDTIAENAHLNFRRVSTEFLCTNCQERYSPEESDLACPVCGSVKMNILAGNEFFLESIDIE